MIDEETRKSTRAFRIRNWAEGWIWKFRPSIVCKSNGSEREMRIERMFLRWRSLKRQSSSTCLTSSIESQLCLHLGSWSGLILWRKELREVWPERRRCRQIDLFHIWLSARDPPSWFRPFSLTRENPFEIEPLSVFVKFFRIHLSFQKVRHCKLLKIKFPIVWWGTESGKKIWYIL